MVDTSLRCWCQSQNKDNSTNIKFVLLTLRLEVPSFILYINEK